MSGGEDKRNRSEIRFLRKEIARLKGVLSESELSGAREAIKALSEQAEQIIAKLNADLEKVREVQKLTRTKIDRDSDMPREVLFDLIDALRESRECEHERSERAIKTLHRVYRKYCQDESSITWEELGNEMLETLCEVMGDEFILTPDKNKKGDNHELQSKS